MADVRIKDLAVTATTTTSDDYLAIDGTTNNTRKVSAYSPTFSGGLNSTPIGASSPNTGAFTSLSSSSTTTLNGTTIPASSTLLTSGGALGTPSSGTVTNLTGTASININGTVGATTPSTGAFTTLSATTSVTTPSLTNAGTLALSATGANILTAATNGTERMRINSTGIVGIGTTDPVQATLHVGSRFAATDTTQRIVGLFSSTDTAVPGAGPSGLYVLYTGAAALENRKIDLNSQTFGSGSLGALSMNGTFHITSAGNVGIGTTPTSGLTPRLQVSSVFSAATASTPYNGIFVESSDAQAADKGGVVSLGGLYDASSGPTRFAAIAGLKENGTSGNYAGYLAFYSRANGGTPAERMRIDSSGNVGIGTTSPAVKLDAFGIAAFGAGGTSGFNITLRDYTTGTARNWGIRDDAGVNRLRFARGATDYWFWDVGKKAASDNVSSQQWRVDDGNYQWQAGGAQRMVLTNSGSLVLGASQSTSWNIEANGTGASVGAYDTAVGTRLIASNGGSVGIVETFTNHDLGFRRNQTGIAKLTTTGFQIESTYHLVLGNAYVAGAPTATGYVIIKDSTGTSYKIPAVAV